MLYSSPLYLIQMYPLVGVRVYYREIGLPGNPVSSTYRELIMKSSILGNPKLQSPSQNHEALDPKPCKAWTFHQANIKSKKRSCEVEPAKVEPYQPSHPKRSP